MEAMHTQTPWVQDEDYILAAGEIPVAVASGTEFDNGEANAAFIVRACNSLEDLVKAASLAYGRLLSLGDYEGRHTMQGQLELCMLRDALAAATGKSAQEVQEQHEAASLAKSGA